MAAYTPRTGQKCSCRPGAWRDNCPQCEGSGWQIDFRAIHAARICPSCKREYTKIPNRERMLNGHMGHLELDPKTGATVLLDEGR